MTKAIALDLVIEGDAEPLAQSVAAVLTPLIAPHLKPPLEIVRVSLDAARDGGGDRCLVVRLRIKDARVTRVPTRWRKQ